MYDRLIYKAYVTFRWHGIDGNQIESTEEVEYEYVEVTDKAKVDDLQAVCMVDLRTGRRRDTSVLPIKIMLMGQLKIPAEGRRTNQKACVCCEEENITC